MTKDVLVQYTDLKKEVQDLKNRIADLERRIDKMEQEGNVLDTVTGGQGGIQHFVIEGFPSTDYSKKRTILLLRKSKLRELEEKITEKVVEVEEFIDNLKDSKIRMILRCRYLDNLTWEKVANNLGPGYSSESVRKTHDRFLEHYRDCPTCPV